MLGISKSDFVLPDFLISYVKENNFQVKEEIHATIVGFQEGKKFKNIEIDFDTLEKKINDIISNADYIKTGYFYHIKKDREGKMIESVVEVLAFNEIEKILEAIKEVTGVSVSNPFLHVTLFIKNDPEMKGIGIKDEKDFSSILKKRIQNVSLGGGRNISKIIIPGRLQVDTSIALFLLKKFGNLKFSFSENLKIEVNPSLENVGEEDLLLDLGNDIFDHHDKGFATTCSRLVAEFLEIDSDPAISKLLAIAERDDFHGKGIVSEDQVDKAFGFPGLVLSVNRKCENNPNKVFEVLAPLLEAHYMDEKHRAHDLPNSLEEKRKNGDAVEFEVTQRGKPVKVIVLSSDDSVMPGFLRSAAGGGNDVVAQWTSTGHVNIITKQVKRINLESLAALVRKSEAILTGVELGDDMMYLSQTGRIKEITNWYFDPATNTLQNGGINPKNISPTKIPRGKFIEILKLGLEESLWKPERKYV